MSIESYTLEKDIEYVKIHGLQRSGTNYLTHLINENFEKTRVLVNLGGWKHGHYQAPWILGREVHVLGIIKNPYSWLVSVYNYWGPNRKLRIGPDLKGVPFEDFVRNRVHLEAQKDVPYLYRASNPVQFWNNMTFHWMSIRMNAKRLFLIGYEALVKEPERMIGLIGKSFDLKQKPTFINTEKSFTPSGEKIKESDKDWNRKHYEDKSYLEMYSPELLEFVNNELDLDIMIKLGYKFERGDQ